VPSLLTIKYSFSCGVSCSEYNSISCFHHPSHTVCRQRRVSPLPPVRKITFYYASTPQSTIYVCFFKSIPVIPLPLFTTNPVVFGVVPLQVSTEGSQARSCTLCHLITPQTPPKHHPNTFTIKRTFSLWCFLFFAGLVGWGGGICGVFLMEQTLQIIILDSYEGQPLFPPRSVCFGCWCSSFYTNKDTLLVAYLCWSK